jgi:hypothetical protein
VIDMPTVYIRKDNYDAIVSMKQDPSAYINHLLDTTFIKTVTYTAVDDKSVSKVSNDDYQKVTTKKQIKK